MVFKKGDPAILDNYRPICLTIVVYPIYASMVKQRLLDAGLDGRLWASQFGFRGGRSTEDAVYVARRKIEMALAARGGCISLLALDWSKAFDSINVASLLDALRRAGFSAKLLQVIGGLMHDRQFFVEDGGSQSDMRPQRSGISQGCTLSPLLFITVMSIMMWDAVSLLSPAARAAHDCHELADLAYADDTLLMGASSNFVQEFLAAVAEAGRLYGLKLHPDKFQLLQLQVTHPIAAEGGIPIASSPSMAYLGANISADGRIGAELCTRIAMAKHDFDTLQHVWRHSCVTRSQKLSYYCCFVESKLLQCLATACFVKADLRRIDGFQCRCLRKILKIPPSFESRISNQEVRRQANVPPLSTTLLERQLLLLGRVLMADSDSPLKTASFISGTWQQATDRSVRRVGRPRKEWVPAVLGEARARIGNDACLATALQSKPCWKQAIR